ncbi:MAG: GNAT family N-acetyltransferase [Gemmatimonadales bacterium]
MASRIGQLLRTGREQGLTVTLRHLRRKAGMRLEWFYWVREMLPEEIPEAYRRLPDGFECVPLGDADFETLGRWQEHGENASPELMRERSRQGYTCLGIRRGGEVIAFCWFALDRTQSALHPMVMAPNEAYLFNAYVLPSERGKNLAAIMRYQCYVVLRDLGRDTLYSITLKDNLASWRFKQKLGAQKLFYAVYFCPFRGVEFRKILKRYPATAS